MPVEKPPEPSPASNRLARESSPYLQQHAGNPVDWYPWGEEAFAQARAQNKPVHLSIGYFACHWCHVMAHECFEQPDIARMLNEGFINVKVDRQERPDVDDLYQRVIQMMGQSGGWPLTVFLTPDQEPFFAGTYFPPQDSHGRPGFPRLLRGLRMAWERRQDEVRENCAQFLRGLAAHDAQLLADPGAGLRRQSDLAAETAAGFARNTDPVHGGMGGAPKFPNASCQDLMLRIARRTGDGDIFAALERTLDHMAAGGIQDHLGGGFARYSVDERWDVPHFEKMLYDNGQLVKLYADAYRFKPKEAWRRVFEDAIAYVQRDLCHPQGGFFASEDADSQGEEGRYYVWTQDEVRAALGDDDALFACHAYSVSRHGNFGGGRSVLQRNTPLDAADEAHLASVRARLFAAREQRVRPGRDENVLAGWNGLMIQGLCAAFQATGSAGHLLAARRAADFVMGHLAGPGGGMMRAWRDGQSGVAGFLEDYSFLANGCFDLYESGFLESDLQRALALVDAMLERFWDDGLYFTAHDGQKLIHRPLAPFDSAWPSGLSEGVLALLRAAAFTGRAVYRERAQRVLERLEPAARRNGFGFAHLLAAREFAACGPVSVRFAGGSQAAAELVAAAHRCYQPGRILVLAQHLADGADQMPAAGVAAAWVCRGETCLPPVHDARSLRELLNQ